MSSGKDLNVALLLDFYSAMLTETQWNLADLYYNEDLSLAEIAEHEGITRQGVCQGIKRSKEILFDMEKALGLAEKSKRLSRIADRLEEKADECSIPELKVIADEVRNVL